MIADGVPVGSGGAFELAIAWTNEKPGSVAIARMKLRMLLRLMTASKEQ